MSTPCFPGIRETIKVILAKVLTNGRLYGDRWNVKIDNRTQGCQIFLDTIYQNVGEIYHVATKLPNGHNIYELAVLYSKWP
jgi:hypothetical protein